MFRYPYSKAAFLAVCLASVGAAYAAKTLENDAMDVTRAKIPLSQAVATAEQHANGRAARAEYEKTKAGWVYDVEVVSGAKVFDVKVDGDRGAVLSSVEDKADRDDDHDKRD
ncbi:MAG: hypothetical protein JWQ03_912 [Variovorax sp.]|nr:hypothetical protein [Variovorax sp.]